MIRAVLRHVPRHKRAWLFGGIGALIGVLAVVGSVLYWSLFNERTQAEYVGTVDHVEEVIERIESANAERRGEVTRALVTLESDLVRQQDGLCDVHPALEWQSSLYRVATYVEECAGLSERLGLVGDEVAMINRMLRDDARVAELIRALALDKDAAEEQWPAILSRWETFIISINTSKISDKTKENIIKYSTDIKLSWEALIRTSESKDQKAYEAAVQEVAASYEAWRELGVRHTAALTDQVSQLRRTYEKL